jgi:hypothetical protein
MHILLWLKGMLVDGGIELIYILNSILSSFLSIVEGRVLKSSTVIMNLSISVSLFLSFSLLPDYELCCLLCRGLGLLCLLGVKAL